MAAMWKAESGTVSVDLISVLVNGRKHRAAQTTHFHEIHNSVSLDTRKKKPISSVTVPLCSLVFLSCRVEGGAGGLLQATAPAP